MSTKTKSLAKSLHTITALVAVARLLAKAEGGEPKHCVFAAASALGYRGAADPYDLKGKAIAILAAE